MMTTSSLTELRQAALALWKHQRQDLERTAARQAAERALDVFGDQAGPLADPDSWQGSADGDAVALPALDDDERDKLEYDHTFDEQLWLRSDCPACGGSGTRITPVSSLLELGQALDDLQEARGSFDDDEVDVEDDGEVVTADEDGEAVVAEAEEAVAEGEDAAAEDGEARDEVDADDLPGACDDCDEASSPAQRLYQAVLDAVEEAGESEEAEEITQPAGRGRG